MPPPAISDIPSLQAHVVPEFSGFELTTPDIARARIFRNHLATYEVAGAMPNLITLTLPNDHTGGTNPLYPTPTTQVADKATAASGPVRRSSWRRTTRKVGRTTSRGTAGHC